MSADRVRPRKRAYLIPAAIFTGGLLVFAASLVHYSSSHFRMTAPGEAQVALQGQAEYVVFLEFETAKVGRISSRRLVAGSSDIAIAIRDRENREVPIHECGFGFSYSVGETKGVSMGCLIAPADGEYSVSAGLKSGSVRDRFVIAIGDAGYPRTFFWLILGTVVPALLGFFAIAMLRHHRIRARTRSSNPMVTSRKSRFLSRAILAASVLAAVVAGIGLATDSNLSVELEFALGMVAVGLLALWLVRSPQETRERKATDDPAGSPAPVRQVGSYKEWLKLQPRESSWSNFLARLYLGGMIWYTLGIVLFIVFLLILVWLGNVLVS